MNINNLKRSLKACKDRLARATKNKDGWEAIISQQHIKKIEKEIKKKS